MKFWIWKTNKKGEPMGLPTSTNAVLSHLRPVHSTPKLDSVQYERVLNAVLGAFECITEENLRASIKNTLVGAASRAGEPFAKGFLEQIVEHSSLQATEKALRRSIIREAK